MMRLSTRIGLDAARVCEIRDSEYQLFRELIQKQSGIELGEQKAQLLRARLGRLVSAAGCSSYREYYDRVLDDRRGVELVGLLDAVSTNTTHFFRERKHFDFLREALQRWSGQRGARDVIRVWSAGCSSGEEAYSIAMTVAETLGAQRLPQVKILATDLSTRALKAAEEGCFAAQQVAGVPARMLRKYFQRNSGAGEYLVERSLQDMIRFARFNLVSASFNFKNRFDVIFCRNVMIYFDRPTQQALVDRFSTVLHSGGYLLIGHSESLSAIKCPLEYLQPTIYRKRASLPGRPLKEGA